MHTYIYTCVCVFIFIYSCNAYIAEYGSETFFGGGFWSQFMGRKEFCFLVIDIIFTHTPHTFLVKPLRRPRNKTHQ